MTPDNYELIAANACLQLARINAEYYAPKDAQTAAIAILIRALEQATPDLSPERRASLFTQGE